MTLQLPFTHLQDTSTTLPGEFAVKEIGPDGGDIAFKGIKLTVPDRALDTPVNIKLGILWGKEFVPNTDKDTALLSPIICCEPHGLNFKKKVVLTIPHCAVNLKTDWKLTVSQT